MARMPKPETQHVSRITEICKRGHYLGSVEASTANAAIKIATREFSLPPECAKRLVAQREG